MPEIIRFLAFLISLGHIYTKNILTDYLKLKFNWRILSLCYCYCSVLLSVCLLFPNLVTLPIDLYGSKIWEPLVCIYNKNNQNISNILFFRGEKITFLGNYPQGSNIISPLGRSHRNALRRPGLYIRGCQEQA